MNYTELPPRYEGLPPDLAGPSIQDGPINVLIVGETQQGKSTLVKHIHTYAGLPDPDIKIGSGNVSCTRFSQYYELDINLRSYHLEDTSGNKIEISKDNYRKLCTYDNEDAKVALTAPESGISYRTIRFNILDTPGLDDSDGKDMDIMAGILAKAGELSHIHAIVYVRNSSTNFGESFKSFFGYLQRSMPSLARGLVIVHSSFTPMRVNSHIRQGKDWSEIRREGFKAATNLELAHFFMDNEPDTNSPLSMVLSLNETCALLSHIKEQPVHPASSFKLLKTPRMQQMDGFVINAVAEVRRVIKNKLEESSKSLTSNELKALEDQSELARLTRKIQLINDDIKGYEYGPDIVLGSVSVTEEFSFLGNLILKQEFNLPGKTMNFNADERIGYVQKSATGGSNWAQETIQGSRWSGFITAGLFRSIRGSATFYVKSEAKYRAQIRSLKEEKNETEEKFKRLDALKTSVSSVQKGIQQLNLLLGQSDELTVAVKRDIMDMKLYPDLRQLYSTTEPRLSRGEIAAFIQVYNPEIAEFYERYI
ncbi:hypothetical protein TWF225_008783 [Orbilia oligospora]|uniref:Uncharacterized protein n=1 Tax=Orbilia oligospora TaxID=2813651 RepID=A0A7C8PVZ8_ORBOL|nr:hypothetical protein TWF225_008783 [Orbilia oligospora]KAF3181407.1 hypothetical protein TWF751_009350 [Orbilia oligospora]KAF3254580.1 hypothetical protein TWF217_006801 [Orbilia oligospora]KAF3259273.1 hypothetical protein TWF128_004350 [Orbilia oligospora]TGJ68858.1 hypothetical protein EYR41_004940 [Orbilia oligospora]